MRSEQLVHARSGKIAIFAGVQGDSTSPPHEASRGSYCLRRPVADTIVVGDAGSGQQAMPAGGVCSLQEVFV